jgi:hypothetical protein
MITREINIVRNILVRARAFNIVSKNLENWSQSIACRVTL